MTQGIYRGGLLVRPGVMFRELRTRPSEGVTGAPPAGASPGRTCQLLGIREIHKENQCLKLTIGVLDKTQPRSTFADAVWLPLRLDPLTP
jgi:hypothetical protein